MSGAINNLVYLDFCSIGYDMVCYGIQAIVQYALQLSEIHIIVKGFLNNYIRGFWFNKLILKDLVFLVKIIQITT